MTNLAKWLWAAAGNQSSGLTDNGLHAGPLADHTNTTSWSFTSTAVGTPASGHHVVVVVAYYDSGTSDIASVSVGATGLTERVDSGATSSFRAAVAIYEGEVTTGGTTQTITVTSTGAVASGVVIYVYSFDATGTVSVHSSASDREGDTTVPTATINYAAGGITYGGVARQDLSPAAAFGSGIDTTDASYNTSDFSSAAGRTSPTSTDTAVDHTESADNDWKAIAVANFTQT